jgi:hypothetical protein
MAGKSYAPLNPLVATLIIIGAFVSLCTATVVVLFASGMVMPVSAKPSMHFQPAHFDPWDDVGMPATRPIQMPVEKRFQPPPDFDEQPVPPWK